MYGKLDYTSAPLSATADVGKGALPRGGRLKEPMIIALDGPAGVGKSTIAIRLAERLGLTYLETGALYRLVALEGVRRGLPDEALPEVAAELDVRFELIGGLNRVFHGGTEVTDALRTPEIAREASRVSALPEVRQALLGLQRRMGREGAGAVLEGRDIGTVVFPDTPWKIFVTATPEVRAKRRVNQMREKGEILDFEQVLADIRQRDRNDSTRAVAPLAVAPGALELDTSDLNAEEVLERCLDYVTGPRGGYRTGLVAIVGRPNVGKSTLMNRILGQKIAIVTPKPNTTRNRILGIHTRSDAQILFLDTPGICQAKGMAGRAMVEAAVASLLEADVVYWVVDCQKLVQRQEAGPEDRDLLQRLKEADCPVILVLNKVDLIAKPALFPILSDFSERMAFAALVPLSAKTGKGVDGLLSETMPLLPVGTPLFPEDQLTDRSRQFIISEFIREQVFLRMNQEIPYCVAVTVDDTREISGKNPLFAVAATIHVERKSQKGILIGKGGSMLKEIGTSARKEIEGYLGRKLFLDLHVKVSQDWSHTARGLSLVGFEK